MDYSTISEFMPVFLIGFIVVGLAEAALKASWNRLYFTIGLPIYIRRVPVSVFRVAPLDTSVLETEFASSFTSRALMFKELEANLYAFREKLMEFRWFNANNTEVMHGVLVFDLNQQQVTVKGYLNWSIAAMILVFVALTLMVESFGWFFILILVVILGIGYAVQANRYGKVARKAAELISAPRKD